MKKETLQNLLHRFFPEWDESVEKARTELGFAFSLSERERWDWFAAGKHQAVRRRAYVSNVSLSQPIASDWVEIYQYLLTRVMGDKVPEELRKESLDNYRMEELKKLKEWIYRKRVKARQERRKMERAKAKAEAEARAPKQLTLGL